MRHKHKYKLLKINEVAPEMRQEFPVHLFFQCDVCDHFKPIMRYRFYLHITRLEEITNPYERTVAHVTKVWSPLWR